MVHGYFKIGNKSCHIISGIPLFMCKIHVHGVSLPYPCRIWGVTGHMMHNTK